MQRRTFRRKDKREAVTIATRILHLFIVREEPA